MTNTRGYTTTYSYDGNRNLQQVTNALTQTTSYQYDADNEPSRVVHPDGTNFDTGYDADGQVLTRTNELGQTTRYSYDTFNRFTAYTDPLTRSSAFSYDLADRLSVITDARGLTTSLGYDPANEQTAATYGSGTPNAAWAYDGLGRRASMTDGTGNTLYTYDSLNRLTNQVNGAGQAITYTWDLADNLANLAYPSNQVVSYAYNAANRMTQLKDWLGYSVSFVYDHNGNLIQQVGSNSVYQTYGFDSENVLTATTVSYQPPSPPPRPGGAPQSPLVGSLLSISYTRDPLEQVAAANDSLDTGHTYSYDVRNRLTVDQPSNVGQADNWGYDPATEITRTVQIGAGGTVTNGTGTYDAADELTHLVQTQGLTTTKNLTLSYDGNGNRTAQNDSVGGTVVNYGYDAAERLTNYNSATYLYSYNGDGLRMQKFRVYSKVSTQYTWDEAGGLPLLLSEGTAQYLYGPGGLVEQIQGSTPYYYHTDQLGSVRALSNLSHTLAATYSYDPYGNTITSTGTLYNLFRYSGEYQDSESGLYYLRARYYDPATQQFLTPDPLLKAGGRQRPFA